MPGAPPGQADRKRNKAGEDQKHEGRSRKSKPRNLGQRLDCGLLPFQVREGLVLE